MKPFNLNEYLKNPSLKVVTRENMPVRILCTDANGNYPIIGLILCNGEDVPENYTENGRYYSNNQDSVNDLFFAPTKKEGWVNIYYEVYYQGNKKDRNVGNIYSSEEEAKEHKDLGYITTIKIEWEE